MTQLGGVSARFPDFPWDTIADARARASAHPEGLVDLSIGTPVDDSPAVAQDALKAAANSPGYPTVFGPETLRQAAVDWLERRFEITGLKASQVLPTMGSKELIAITYRRSGPITPVETCNWFPPFQQQNQPCLTATGSA